MRIWRTPAAALALLLLSPCARAVSDLGSWLELQAREAPAAPFGQVRLLPLDFIEHLRREGHAVEQGAVRGRGGEAVSNKSLRDLYAAFRASGPPAVPAAPSPAKATPSPSLAGLGAGDAASLFDGKKPADPLPVRFTGIELGRGPHPASDPLGQSQPVGLGVAGRVRLDGLGARAQYRHAADWPTFTAGALAHLDLVGSMNLDRAREGLYAASLQRVETPQRGFEVSAGASFLERFSVHASYGDKETVYPPALPVRQQKAEAGVGLNPLGRDAARPWSLGLSFAPDYQRVTSGPLGSASEREGLGFSAGVAFRYALDKLPVSWLRPPPKGNGVVWPVQAKTSVVLSASEVSPVSVEWAVQASLFVTKYLLVTPGVNTTLRPTSPGPKVGAGPLLGLDIRNPADS